jgi:hypothetical protein
MAKFIRVDDPTETERRLHIQIKEADCPGLLGFLRTLPYGAEAPLIRAVLQQWFQAHAQAGTLDAALDSFAAGRSDLRRKSKGAPLQPLSPSPLVPGVGAAQLITGPARIGTAIRPHEAPLLSPYHLRDVQGSDQSAIGDNPSHAMGQTTGDGRQPLGGSIVQAAIDEEGTRSQNMKPNLSDFDDLDDLVPLGTTDSP